jgi:hypothetical protein
MLRFANLSSILDTFLKSSSASDLLDVLRNFFIKVLAVLAWYLFLILLASLDLILFNADL